MDILDLRRRFDLACELYNIPALMYTNGMQKLETIIDIQASSGRTLFLRPRTGWHILQRPYSCYRMVYLLFKGEGVSYDESNNSIFIPSNAQVYAGQTLNFRNRDSSRTGPMRDSNLKLCLAHDLTMYQRDSLETVTILFSLFVFGLRCKNNTIYPVHIYLRIPTNMTWEDTYTQNMLLPTNTWTWSDRVMVISTAPPATVLEDPDYQNSLVSNTNPIMDLRRDADRSINSAILVHLLQNAVDQLPPFVNHFPAIECDNWSNFRSGITFEDILEADRNLRETITNLRRDVIVMVGRRPTLLYPHSHRSSYFTSICPHVNIYWLPDGNCGLVFWWIHPGLRWHGNRSNALLVEHILQLSAIQLRIVLGKINLVSGDTIGIPEATAAALIPWILELPVSQEISELLRKLSNLWGAGVEDRHDHSHPFSMDAVYYHGEDADRIPHEIERGLLPVSIEVMLPRNSVSEVVAHWSYRYQTLVMRKTLQRVPHFHVLSEQDKALEIQRTSRIGYATLLRGILDKWVSTGRFFPFEGESPQDQWIRLLKQISFERLNKSIHPRAAWYTCCWCGLKLNRVLYDQTSVVANHQSMSCPHGSHLTKGWQIIETDYTGLFPGCNLFVLFYESLPAGLVMNQKQLAASLMHFMYQQRWHPQAKYIYERYEAAAPLIETFESNEQLKGTISMFILSVKRAMEKLAELPTPIAIQWTKRYTLREEWEGRINISTHQTLYGINTYFEDPKMMIPLEDFEYLGYRQHFNIRSVGVPYP